MLYKAEASRGREALSLISQSVGEFKNKEDFMSDTNFDKLRGKGKGIRIGLYRSLIT